MKNFVQFQFNCDRLWKLWYSILVIFTQIILIIFAISNYLTYKSQAFDPRYGSSWSMIPLNFQLASIILSISLLVWLIYSCMFKVGHIANDGTELGLDSDSIKKALIEISSHKGISLFGSRLITHALPYNCLIHLIISLLLALPVPLMQAEQIRKEAISPGYLWTTSIDFLINPNSLRVIKENAAMCHRSPCEYSTKPSSISPEFVNMIVSLLIIVIRLPSPFWYTNKAFSIVFSLFAFVSAFCISMEYESLILIIKIVYNPNITKRHFDSYIAGWIILVIFFVKSLLMLFMLLIVFEYGYTQYLSNMRKYRQYFSSDISDSVSQQSLNNHKIKWYHAAPRLVGIIVVICVKALKMPILYTQISYIKSNDKLHINSTVIVSVCISLFYFLTSVFLWFGLCVKNKWQFHINIQTNPIPNIGAGKLTGSPEPIYGCFYNVPSGLSQISFTKPMLKSSLEGSDFSNSRNAQPTNYVFMHTGMNQAMNSNPIHENSQFMIDDSEVSFESNTKSCDSDDNKRYNCLVSNLENSQYATLASLQSGGIIAAKAMSDSSSNDNYPRNQLRRPSNRVTFKDENNTFSLNYPISNAYYSNNFPTSKASDIISLTNTEKSEICSSLRSPHGFDPELEMSTDMRQVENFTPNRRDPKLCSQV